MVLRKEAKRECDRAAKAIWSAAAPATVGVETRAEATDFARDREGGTRR
jgi:hypothetical protein